MEMSMASVVHFTGTVFATKTQEAFYGDGSFDTVSYANAPNIFKLGDYDAGVTVNLANPSGNLGWALGDTYVGVEKIVGSQYTDWLYGNSQRTSSMVEDHPTLYMVVMAMTPSS